ncbi:MAG: hypothetical protein WC455_30440 [Dehalococcoidia bacterium]|jgi:hypothetical protein
MNRLKNTRCYLCGPIETCQDGGILWRGNIMRRLDCIGIRWLDPCNKPTSFITETPADNMLLQEARAIADWDTVAERMLWIRRVDLRMVHLADFLIVHLDARTPTFGSIEEITWANQEKKPILVHCEQGKTEAPLWLFGMIPHEMIFSTWLELERYVRYVDHDKCLNTDQITTWSENRWHLFNFHGD